MFQNKIKQFMVMGQLVTLVLSVVFLFSCAPRSATTRPPLKTTQQNLDGAISAQSQQQAQTQGTNYVLHTISIPKPIPGGQEISIELQTPGNQYLSVTTQHINGQLESNGNYNDQVRGLEVNIQAKCSDTACTKYTALVTVSKGGQRLFQNGAISFDKDCNFYSISVGSNVANLFQGLHAFDSHYTLAPKNDCAGTEM